MMRKSTIAGIVAGLLWTALPGAAQVASQPLAVAGDVASPMSLTAEQLKALPRTKVEVNEDGRALVYEGVVTRYPLIALRAD